MTTKKYSLKVILVGNSGVGKTSLVSAFFDNPFESQSLPTVAPASCSAIINLDDETTVELQIWDTAGQERFQSISHMFYRDSHIAFVCYDPTTADSIETWIERVHNDVPECIIFLVLTKADLLDETERINEELRGIDMMKRCGAKTHVLTSASKNMGVSELFRSAAQFVDQIYMTNTPTEDLDLTASANGDRKCC